MTAPTRPTVASPNWWDRYSSLLKAEMDAFARHGAGVKTASEANGLLVLEVDWTASGDPIRLLVGFSTFHPYGRPSVSAPDIRLARHQHPFSGTLCLLTQGTEEWLPGEKVADLIAGQLPQVLSAAAAHAEGRPEDAAGIEENAPDPLSAYFSAEAEPGSVIVYDPGQLIPPGDTGIATFTLRPRTFGPDVFEGVLRSLEPLSGPWRRPEFMPWKDSMEAPVQGRWVRLRPGFTEDPAELLAAAEAVIASSIALNRKAAAKMAKPASLEPMFTVIVFDEEIEYGRTGTGCLFLLTRGRGKARVTKIVTGCHYAADVMARVPVSEHLRDKRVLLVGAGAIGSFVALELVRAGVGKLGIIDRDSVEPGNGVRWPLSREFWGLPKVQALQLHLLRNYPGSEVTGYVAHLGAATSDPELARLAVPNPVEFIRAQIADADVVVDATASIECQLILGDLCRELGTPLVMGHATEGAAGGMVARFSPGVPGCRVCLGEHWSDKTLPSPPVGPSGTLTLVGCNAPTFTAGSYDLQEVSLAMVRSAISYLQPGGLNPDDWTLAVLALTEDGRRILPRWTAAVITPHPLCADCSGA